MLSKFPNDYLSRSKGIAKGFRRVINVSFPFPKFFSFLILDCKKRVETVNYI
jgi:hypothetical protein